MLRLTMAFLAVLVILCPNAYAQDWAKAKLDKSNRHLEWVTVEYDKRTVKCFVAYPEVKTKAPVVLVIHEIFGLSDWVRNVADQLAAEGYIAACPDLLSHMGPNGGDSDSIVGQDAQRKAVSSLPQDQIDADLQAVADYATKLPATNGKLAVTGFCWGGSQTFIFANKNKNKNTALQAGFPFYGRGPKDESEAKGIGVPLYGFYAENDERVTSTVAATEAIMKKLGKKYEVVIYKEAGHGFMRTGESPEANEADKQARAAAWKRFTEQLSALK